MLLNPVTLLSLLAGLGPASAEPHRRGDITKAHARAAIAALHDDRSTLAKRFSGTATWYDTSTGQLACGGWGNNEAYIVALNSAQYGSGYPGPQCFKTLTITANGVTVGGVQVADECPTCAYGDLDLSPGLFRRFATEDTGVFQLVWGWDDGSAQPAPEPSPTSTWSEPAPTTESKTSTPTPTETSTSSTSTMLSTSVSLNATSTTSMGANGTLSLASASGSVGVNATSTLPNNAKATAAAGAASTGGLSVVAGEGKAEGGVLGCVGQLIANVGYMIAAGAVGQ